MTMALTRHALDLLEMPLQDSERIARDGRTFRVDAPWALASFGEHEIPSGWWVFEAEADSVTYLMGVELRLSTPKDPLVVFRGNDSSNYRVRLGGGEHYRIDLLVSPWPGRVSFSRLRLRRLSALEEAALLTGGALRLLGRDRPFTRIANVLTRIASGRPVGVQFSGPQPRDEAMKVEVKDRRTDFVTLEQGGVTAIVYAADELHPQAFEIAKSTFENAEAQALYSDAFEGGELHPLPQWDEVLAQYTDYFRPPLFFRSPISGNPIDAMKRIAEAHGPAAVCRIPLPLAKRQLAARQDASAISLPVLSTEPKVSIIIPTKYRLDLLEKCLAGLASSTVYRNFEVVVVDNGSTDRRLPEVLANARKSLEVIALRDERPFNYPELNNVGIAQATGAIILLLNDDVEPIEAGWLTRMVASVLEPRTGAVGARLLYPNRSVQHAGVMMGIGGVCGHLWKGLSPEAAASVPQITFPSRRLAVTAACLAIRREVYEEVGGLDADYGVALNDIDLCLKLHAAGYHNICRGDAVLLHHESQSRGADSESLAKHRRLTTETTLFLSRWRQLLANDPYGSPAYDLMSEQGRAHSALTGDDISWKKV